MSFYNSETLFKIFFFFFKEKERENNTQQYSHSRKTFHA